jgi:hypothetical protein
LYSTAALRNILNLEQRKLWEYLYFATAIITSPIITKEMLDVAHDLFIAFNEQFKRIDQPWTHRSTMVIHSKHAPSHAPS